VDLILARDVAASGFAAGLKAFEAAIGGRWVMATYGDRDAYGDPYALGDGRSTAPSAALAPANLEELRAVVRIANEHRLPLWPVSRGKNLGYGGAGPAMPGTIVLDLGRMNRIIDIDAKFGHCLIEPGVGFYDLFQALEAEKIPLWMSIPANAWGSVIGNALERGIGYTPYGDNTSKLCGLEIVTPTGDVVRTGMGAIGSGRAWQNYQYSFGPSWDQMLAQSNLGIVTKAGLWLMPEPEMTAKVRINLPRFDDIGWAIDALAELRRRDVIQHNIVFGNYLHDASVFSQRDRWYQGPGAIPDAVSERIMAEYGLGWWSFGLSLFGCEGAVKAHMDVVRKAMEPRLGKALEFVEWRRGEPYENSARPRPSVVALQISNWRGGRGGHIGFSPVMPPDGALALEQARKRKARFEQFGQDYYTSFTMGQRHISNVNLIIYDRDDEAQVRGTKGLFEAMLADAAADGFGEYRTHTEYMDEVAGSFDFNDHALRRLNEQVKDCLDPNGILAPGKSGIWPARYRKAQK